MADNSAGEYVYGPDDSYINSQAAQGQKTYEKQRYGRPRFGFPNISQDQVDRDRLLNALLGASAGAQAANTAAHPLAALAMGLGGGISASQAGDMRAQRQKVQQGLQEEQLNLTPVGQAAPGMVGALRNKYGMDVSEIPLGQFQKFSGLLQHSQDLEKQMLLIRARAQQRGGELTPQARKLLAEITGLDESELKGITGSEAQKLGLTPRPLTEGMTKLLGNVRQGVANIGEAMPLIESADSVTFKLAAIQGMKGDVLRIRNPDAQRINRLLSNASDVLTRLRTGAALNRDEEVYYGKLLNNVLRSPEENKASIVELYNFFDRAEREIEAGQRGPGAKILKSGREDKFGGEKKIGRFTVVVEQ